MDWVDNFDLFLFDFDGLLVNTEHIHYQAYVNMLKKRGYNLDWSFDAFCEIAHVTQDGLRISIYAKFPDLYDKQPRWEILYNEKKQIYYDLLKSAKIELMPGVKELLTSLDQKKIKRCVVTNSTKEQTDLIMSYCDILKTIPDWITREDYINPKPDPECYLRAIQFFGEKGDRIIGFEDTLRGLKALNKTPAKCVLICHAHHPQMDTVIPKGVYHFESFSYILQNYSFS